MNDQSAEAKEQETVRCPQCWASRPKSEMKPRAITQIQRGGVVTETMLFCADKPCGEHYQMGCEG